MVRLTKIYTRTGDKGQTSLGDGTRVSKENHRVEAYGTIDEANSILGLVRTTTKQAELILLDNILATIQNELFDLGAELSIPINEKNEKLLENTKISEKQIDKNTSQYLSESDKRLINKMISKFSIKEIINIIQSKSKISKCSRRRFC